MGGTENPDPKIVENYCVLYGFRDAMFKNLGPDMTFGGDVNFGHLWHEALLFTIQNQHRVHKTLLFTVETLKAETKPNYFVYKTIVKPYTLNRKTLKP